MKTYNSVTGYEPRTYDGRIITFGLNAEQNQLLKLTLGSINYEFYHTDIASDLVALFATAIIVNAKELEADDLKLLENYYTEVSSEAEETVYWLGSPKPSIELQLLFKCFDSFDEMMVEIRNFLNNK